MNDNNFMIEDFFNLIMAYTLNGKKADKNFAEKVIEIYFQTINLNKYIKNVKLLDKTYYESGQYDSEAQTLIVNPDFIAIDIINSMQKSYYKLDELHLLLWTNLEVFFTILHEIEHANQEKLFTTGDKTIEGIIVRATFHFPNCHELNEQKKYFKMFIEYIKYKKNYDILPTERLAQLKAYKIYADVIDRVFGNENFAFSQLDNIYDETYVIPNLYDRMRGYYKKVGGVYVGASYLYTIKSSNRRKAMRELEFYSINPQEFLDLSVANISKEERILYGLPLTRDEQRKLKTLSLPVGPNRSKALRLMNNSSKKI